MRFNTDRIMSDEISDNMKQKNTTKDNRKISVSSNREEKIVPVSRLSNAAAFCLFSLDYAFHKQQHKKQLMFSLAKTATASDVFNPSPLRTMSIKLHERTKTKEKTPRKSNDTKVKSHIRYFRFKKVKDQADIPNRCKSQTNKKGDLKKKKHFFNRMRKTKEPSESSHKCKSQLHTKTHLKRLSRLDSTSISNIYNICKEYPSAGSSTVTLTATAESIYNATLVYRRRFVRDQEEFIKDGVSILKSRRTQSDACASWFCHSPNRRRACRIRHDVAPPLDHWKSADNLFIGGESMRNGETATNEDSSNANVCGNRLVNSVSVQPLHQPSSTSRGSNMNWSSGNADTSVCSGSGDGLIQGQVNSSTPSSDVSQPQLDLSNITPTTHVIQPTPTEGNDGHFTYNPTYIHSHGYHPSRSPSPKCNRGSSSQLTSHDSAEEKSIHNEISPRHSYNREESVESQSHTDTHQMDNEKQDAISRSSESNKSYETSRLSDGTNSIAPKDRDRKESQTSKSGDKDKKSRKAWYAVLNPTYKSRSEELKRTFKELPPDERLIVDYSCALQRDILIHGRLYVTSNYFCFYSKIFGWETFLSIKCRDIAAITKEKTALVIPNAIQINTDSEKHFFTTFATRDKTYLMLFRIWQNALMDQQMSTTDLWQCVHSCYGEELGLTSDDDDYVAPSTEDDTKSSVIPPHTVAHSDYSSHSFPLEESMDASQAEVGVDESSTQNSNKNNQTVDSSHPDASATEQQDGGDAGGHSATASIPSTSHSKSYKHSPTKSKHSPSKSKHSPSKRHLQHETLLHAATATAAAIVNTSAPSPSENNDLPTDFSGSSDNEENKLPASGAKSVVCPDLSSLHQGREVFNKLFTLPIDTVFTLLFTNSKFMLDLHTARKTYNVVASPWQSNPNNNKKLRQVTYTLTLPTNNFGPKVSHVTETQVMSDFSKPGEIYTVDAEACNAGIPYADSFSVSNHWCLTRESRTETRVCVWSDVKYKKNVWGFMKNVIDKNSFSGVESLMNDINSGLLIEVDRTNQIRTKRRRRRAGSKATDPPDILPSMPDKIKETHKPTQVPSRKMTSSNFTQDTIVNPVESIVKLVIAILTLLFLLNGLLYYKLWALEEKVLLQPQTLSTIDPALLRGAMSNGEGAIEDWVKILQQQEALHTAEVERWRKAVGEVAEYLKKAEESLRVLHSSIPSHHASKLQILLRQVQSLHQSSSKYPPHSSVKDQPPLDPPNAQTEL